VRAPIPLLAATLLLSGCSGATVTIGGPPPTPTRDEILTIAATQYALGDGADPTQVALVNAAWLEDDTIAHDIEATVVNAPRNLDDVIGQARATATVEPTPAAGESVSPGLVWVILRSTDAELVKARADDRTFSCAVSVPGAGTVSPGDQFAIADAGGVVFTPADEQILGRLSMRDGGTKTFMVDDDPDKAKSEWADSAGMFGCRFQMSGQRFPPSDSYAIVLGEQAAGPFRFTAEEAVASMQENDGTLVLTFDVDDAGK